MISSGATAASRTTSGNNRSKKQGFKGHWKIFVIVLHPNVRGFLEIMLKAYALKFRPEGMNFRFIRGNSRILLFTQLRTPPQRGTCPPMILNSEANQMTSDTRSSEPRVCGTSRPNTKFLTNLQQ